MPLIISYHPFKVLPEGYPVGPSKVNAYIFSSNASLSGVTIDLSSNSYIDIAKQPWITLNEFLNELTIFTLEGSFTGVYKIVLVQSFDAFADVHPHSTF